MFIIKCSLFKISNWLFLGHNHLRKFSSKNMTQKLIWVDCEMTGLNVDRDQLLEIALLDQFDPIHINASSQVLESMNDWCQKQFRSNGLYEECLRSKIQIEEADNLLAEFMVRNKIKQGILAGNSIATDRQFLNKYCPKFVSHLHYRMVDVSSIKVLVDMWYKDREFWNVNTPHRALGDINKSIEEIKYYKEKYFLKL
ncbi:Oligoribonuclease, mitochondrial [Dermatophagoides farinae]|uniref:Oligoribonuclease, mitochondrial n=1 Tax=Dermatophagoides farinae TaxID=6954 RepID=A0A922L2V1_DERFA|nr:ubiquitin specific protease-like protein 2 [Dermatophagoides farinae]KAH9516448.1 Oligoribonuclease, mitochondrial [Dermatophagoides farinae]